MSKRCQKKHASIVLKKLALSQIGRVTAWDVFTGRAGSQNLQVWRPVTERDGEETFKLICENLVTAHSEGIDFHFQLPESEHCYVQRGDVIGWFHKNQGVTDYDGGGHDVKWHYGDHPGIGGQLTFDAGGARTYSVAATVRYCQNCGQLNLCEPAKESGDAEAGDDADGATVGNGPDGTEIEIGDDTGTSGLSTWVPKEVPTPLTADDMLFTASQKTITLDGEMRLTRLWYLQGGLTKPLVMLPQACSQIGTACRTRRRRRSCQRRGMVKTATKWWSLKNMRVAYGTALRITRSGPARGG